VDEQRLIDIEIKLAHQERALDEVNRVLTDQQALLTRLERVCESLADRLRGMSEAAVSDAGDDQKPPHY
jgi:SlyX protein